MDAETHLELLQDLIQLNLAVDFKKLVTELNPLSELVEVIRPDTVDKVAKIASR